MFLVAIFRCTDLCSSLFYFILFFFFAAAAAATLLLIPERSFAIVLKWLLNFSCITIGLCFTTNVVNNKSMKHVFITL